MRLALTLLLGLAGCGEPQPPEIDRIEIQMSGWEATDVVVNRSGEGHFRLSEPYPKGRSGTFTLTAEQFLRLRDRLEPYRRQAAPVTTSSAQEFLERTCPRGVPFATDSGAVYIQWIGPAVNQHFLADLGCDHRRQASRNEDLLDLAGSFPIPKSPR